MSIPVTLRAAAVAALFAACSIDISGKTSCNVDSDCLPGDVCVLKHCGPDKGLGGTAGGGNGGGTGGNTGTFDGGYDILPPRMCPAKLVNACPPDADAGTRCEQTFCGGRLSPNNMMTSLLVSYRFHPDANFSDSYRTAIRAGAAAWARASAGFVTFKECSLCTGKYISVVPGNEDGIKSPDAAERLLPMPVDSGGRVSPHRIAHQWGHVLGLSHTYQRADRDRYMGFDPDVWCSAGGLPPLCAADPADMPGLPAVTTGTFGVFDGKSKMNGLRSEGICGAEEPDEDSGEPTIGDVSALGELFFSAFGGWSPFRPVVPSVSPNQPLDQLAPGVDPTGSPQIAEVDYASPEIFVRGTDDRVYTTARIDPLSSSTQWRDWMPVEDDVDADPAVVFARLLVGPDETLFLAVRSKRDGEIHLRTRHAGSWGDSTSLGAPAAGAASAPALASENAYSVDVLVRGGDGLIYWLNCPDAQNCAASASQPGAWTALPPPPSPSGIFVGKPSAFWSLDNTGLRVAAISDDRVAYLMTGVEAGVSNWVRVDSIKDDLAPDDPDPGVAIAAYTTPSDVAFFARNQHGLLVTDTLGSSYFPIGGVLASPPGVVAIYIPHFRTDVVAIIDDHGHPGVWWRYFDQSYQVPCYYNSPDTCLVCGLP